MNLTTQNAKNLISKDNELSKKAAFEILNTCDTESFKTICDNSEQMFDFVIDKVVKNLTHATNEGNIKSTFEFAKTYNPTIGQFINNVWLKFANEDLTDEILEILENGTNEQKIYAAKYFEKINDPLALELLSKYAFCDNTDLSTACATALGAFNDSASHDVAISMLNEDDDFKKFSAMAFLINYAKKDDISTILKELENSPFAANIAAEILYKYNLEELKNTLNKDEILKLYNEIISSYPEDIGLETIFDFNLLNFTKEYFTDKNSLANRVIADLKNVISLINADNIYTYDLNKNCINNIKKIDEVLEKYKPDANIISDELFQTQKRAQRAINTLIALGDTSCCEKIEKLYTTTNDPLLLCECARAAKNLGFKLEKETGLDKISDKNALELFKSYF